MIVGDYCPPVTVDHEGDEYIYVQLASILRDRIHSGDLPPGRALPSARTLSQEHGVAIGTVKKAVDEFHAAIRVAARTPSLPLAWPACRW